MRRFGILTIAAGVWVGGVAHAQDASPEARGAVVGGPGALNSSVSADAELQPPPPPPGPDLPVAIGNSAGLATFQPGGGKPSGGGGAPSSPNGGRGMGNRGGGGGSGGGGGGASAPKTSGLPLLPAQSQSLTNTDTGTTNPDEAQPSVGGQQGSMPTASFFPPPPSPVDNPGPINPPPPPPLGSDSGSGNPPGPIVTDPEPPPGPGPGGGSDGNPPPVVGAPEPGTLVLAGIGGLAAMGWRRRRRV